DPIRSVRMRTPDLPENPRAPATRRPWYFLRLAAEQRQDVLVRRVGNRQSLNAELLLNLQGRQTCRFLAHVSIDERANALFDGVLQTRQEARLAVDLRLGSTECSCASRQRAESGFYGFKGGIDVIGAN